MREKTLWVEVYRFCSWVFPNCADCPLWGNGGQNKCTSSYVDAHPEEVRDRMGAYDKETRTVS